MRRTLISLLGGLLLLGCPGSHGRDRGDTGPDPDAPPCLGWAPSCVSSCADAVTVSGICVDGAWVCRPGTVDSSTCPPRGCDETPPPGCECVGGAWLCDPDPIGCPPGINPYDPSDPVNACFEEGATCSEGGDPCGNAMFCTCETGRWSCAIAHPDPVCTCGREPSVGDPCAAEGMACGECCPTLGGTGWPAMQCEAGRWEHAACPDVECPPIRVECPTETPRAIGASCSTERQLCGNACCGTAITCTGGAWERGPEADCACEPQVPCGAGECPRSQYCELGCGPDDGPLFTCVELPPACAECGCLTLEPWQSCRMVDGHPFVDGAFCG